jgi:hypothetical protein
MLYKLKSKPTWYRIWAITVALAAFYFLYSFTRGSISTLEYGLAVYAFGSLVADQLLFPTKTA